jgi:serine protease AprX
MTAHVLSRPRRRSTGRPPGRRWVLALAGLALGASALPASAQALPADGPAGAAPPALARAIVTFGEEPPSAQQVDALRGLGLSAQGLRRLPFALVQGPQAAVDRARGVVGVTAVHPDFDVEPVWTRSNETIRVHAALRAAGLTGKGVQVAVVDTGIDGTHPDLADHVKENLLFAGPQQADLPPGTPPGTVVVSARQLPVNSTEVAAGHGTAVAGVLAADGTTSPEQVGVAPDVDVYGLAIDPTGVDGAMMIAAWDHILAHPEWGIDVVNTSYGRSIPAPFDPTDPALVATRALADAGIVVVLPMGNTGTNAMEMTMSPLAYGPWVIAAAGTDVAGARWAGSSNGLEVDNSLPVGLAGGHARFEGDRIGLYRPSVAAPAAGITTSCRPAVFTPDCGAARTTTGSGTSYAAPHVAGVAALLLQANPDLTPAEVKAAMEATARPTADGAPSWQSGFGLVDAEAAVELVRRPDFRTQIAARHRQAVQRDRAAQPWRVEATEHWSWVPDGTATPEPAGATVSPAQGRDLPLDVPAGTDAVKVAFSYPTSPLGSYLGVARTGSWSIVVRDAAGTEVGRTTLPPSQAVGQALVDLRTSDAVPGRWTLQVRGDAAVIEQVGLPVWVTAALLEARQPAGAGGFVATGRLPLHFAPDPARVTGVRSPEGCEVDAGEPRGSLAPERAAGACRSGATGATVSVLAEAPAAFTSAPLQRELTVGGDAALVVHLTEPARRSVPAPQGGRLLYVLDELAQDGSVRAVASGTALLSFVDGRNTGRLRVPTTTLAEGSRLRVRLEMTGANTSAARFLYGGERYGDAGLTLTTGRAAGDAG